MNKRGRRFYIGVVFFLVIACVGIPIIIDLVRPSEAEKICTSLLAAGRLASEEECIRSNWSLDYAPHYFPIEQTSIDDVKIGMQEFGLLSTFSKSSCTQGGRFTQLRYGLDSLNTAEITFNFCDDLLTSISHHH
ncbi:MAG: hypothetical protein H6652_19105 [Ardenticatenaceae bacterium]|nr:hypothetical protein [Ardenticatenaceae bacterium]MCB8949145.1 hypothetical protein [Ardenticatenaceae bacterium]